MSKQARLTSASPPRLDTKIVKLKFGRSKEQNQTVSDLNALTIYLSLTSRLYLKNERKKQKKRSDNKITFFFSDDKRVDQFHSEYVPFLIDE